MRYLGPALTLMALGAASPAMAGPYGDDLSKCLVDSTTAEDRVALVRWMFSAVSVHPAVESMATVAPDELEKSSAAVGALFMRLLTESCLEESKTAIKYEGPATLQLSFNVLGQVAGTEMFSNPEVATATAALEKYVDKDKLEHLKD